MKKVEAKKKVAKKKTVSVTPMPLKCLARAVEYATATWIESDGHPPDVRVIFSVGEVRQLIDEFPDDEVDEVFVKELRRRIDTNGERLIEVGRVLKVDLIRPKNEQEEKWRSMLI